MEIVTCLIIVSNKGLNLSSRSHKCVLEDRVLMFLVMIYSNDVTLHPFLYCLPFYFRLVINRNTKITSLPSTSIRSQSRGLGSPFPYILFLVFVLERPV